MMFYYTQKFVRTEHRSVQRVHGVWHGEFNGYKVSIWGDEKVLDIVMMVSQHVNVINATKMHN